MTDQSTHTTDVPRDDRYEDGTLDRFERNRFFNGKLMTARDMRADQRYHARRLHAFARGVAGEGVVDGLDVTVSGGEDALTVEIGGGIALDSYGRPVVVPQDRLVTIDDDPAVLNADRVSVYIEYDDCVRESVPLSGSGSACEEQCAYNRVLEIYDVRVEPTGADAFHGKDVPSLEFPTRGDLTSVDGRGPPAADDPGLAKIAETYARGAETDGTTDVFLGVFVDGGDDSEEWTPDASAPLARVYTNDMLYAATARHAADFENPHQVTLRTDTGDGTNGAGFRVVDDERDGADVRLDSGDETVDVSLHSEQVIDLSVEEYVTDVEAGLEEQVSGVEDSLEAIGEEVSAVDDRVRKLDEELREAIDERLDAQERHAVEQALKDTALVFRTAARRFRAQREEAQAVSHLARAVVDARLDTDTDEEAAEERVVRKPTGEIWFELTDGVYPELFERLGERLIEFDEAIEADVTDRSYRRLEQALGRLRDAVASEQRLRLAAAQDDVCDAVEWLEPQEVARFEPGARVVDREDTEPDTAVVLRELSVPIDDWLVYGEETVAEHNPEYDDEPVVIVSFERLLDDRWDEWRKADPEVLFEAVQERSIKFHAFPRARLERLSPEDPE